MPSADDLLNLMNLPVSYSTGAWERVRTMIQLVFFSQLCACKAAPGFVSPPIHGNQIDSGTVCNADDTYHAVRWQGPMLPYPQSVSARVTAISGNEIGVWIALVREPIITNTRWNQSGSLGVWGIGPFEDGVVDYTYNFPMGGWTNEPHLYPTIIIDGTIVPTCVQIVWDWTTKQPQPTPPPPPIAPAAPTDVPAAPNCPTMNSLQDLGNFLCNMRDEMDAINAKLDYLARQVNPPETIPDDQPTPPDENGDVKKPDTAIGLIVELTSIPAHYPHYGTPAYYPNVGHVLLKTKEGPLPSQLVKHNPMVVLPLPPQITDAVLDLSPGVAGQIRWMKPPK